MITLSDSERTVGRAWMLLCALHPEHFAAELEALVTGLERADADEQDWWRALRDQTGATPAQLAAALLSHSMAEEQTHLQRQRREEARAREEEDKRRARTEQRWERITAAVIVTAILGVLLLLLSLPRLVPVEAHDRVLPTVAGGVLLVGLVIGFRLGGWLGAVLAGFLVWLFFVLSWLFWGVTPGG